MKKRYVLAICLATILRLQAQDMPGNNGFGPEQSVLPLGSTVTLTTDLDGDGDQDLVVASRVVENRFPPTNTTGKLVWYANDGQNNFGRPQTITEDRTTDIHTTDLDGDGDQDLVAILDDRLDTRIIWYANDGQGNFDEGQPFSSTENAITINIADLDGDGDQDVLSSIYFGYQIDSKFAWYANDGQGNLGEARFIDGVSLDFFFTDVTDLNGDGSQDLLVYSFAEDNRYQIGWLANDGQNNFEPLQPIGQAEYINDIQSADLDGDGDQDILLSSDESDAPEVAWYVNDGQGNFDERRSIGTTPTRYQCG